MDSTEIVYLVRFIKAGEIIYDKNGVILGEFTGYNTRPTYKSNGSIEIKRDNKNMWVSGKAVYIPCMGLKFTEDFKTENNLKL